MQSVCFPISYSTLSGPLWLGYIPELKSLPLFTVARAGGGWVTFLIPPVLRGQIKSWNFVAQARTFILAVF